MSCAASPPGRLWPGLAAAVLVCMTQAQAQTPTQAPAPQPGPAPAHPAAPAPGPMHPPVPSPVPPTGEALSPENKTKASYAIGLTFGTQMKRAGLTSKTISMPEVEKGLEAALGGKEITPEDSAQIQRYIMALRQALADENHAKATAFLAANAKKPGVTTTASGLQYRVIAPGSGDPPKRTDRVAVKYTGKLLDGTVFDSTDKQGGKPAEFPVGGSMIAGFTEALLLMRPGAKFTVYMPPQLAYDVRVPPQAPIPPGSALIFDLELVKILPPAPPGPPHPPAMPPHPAVPPAPPGH